MAVDYSCSISLQDGQILIKADNSISIPIEQLESIIVTSNNVLVSSALMNKAAELGICMVFCDEKHNPSFEIAPYSRNFAIARNSMLQAQWNEERKTFLWTNIVKTKIKSQINAIKSLDAECPKQLLSYYDNVLLNDSSNREGQAARIYFNALFGKGFSRQDKNDINSGLNYGYSLILSAFNRAISLHGYNMSLGIKHCNPQNRFNLSCDFMEPFRPVIDRVVYLNKERCFDWEYKKQLIAAQQTNVLYGGKRFQLHDAIENYTLDCLAIMNGKQRNIKEVNFEQ